MTAPVIESLTDRERQILGLVLLGKGSDDISNALYISRKTVEAHRAGINRKLGIVGSRGRALWALAVAQGWVARGHNGGLELGFDARLAA